MMESCQGRRRLRHLFFFFGQGIIIASPKNVDFSGLYSYPSGDKQF